VTIPILPAILNQICCIGKLHDSSSDFLDVAKRAVEIAIEQDEHAVLDFISRESKNSPEFGEMP
jgi:hypothetical protein